MDSVDERRSPSLPTAPTATSVPSISLSIPLLLAVPDPTMSCPQKPGAAHEQMFLAQGMGDSVATLRRLSSLGVTISIDDFGTGYSSLGRLQRLPVDKLKIDKSFVAELGKSRDAEMIVRAIIGLAR